MKNIGDDEFKKICELIFLNFLNKNNKINQINIYFGENKLFCAKYENFSHLLGLQYYETILNLSQKNKRKDFFKWFIYSVINNKILFSSIIKKIKTNWKFVSGLKIFKNFKNSKELIYILQQKIKCFENFVNFIYENKNGKSFTLYKTHVGSKIDYFLNFDNNKSLIGLKYISTTNYTYETFIPMSFQIRKLNKKFNMVDKYKINRIYIK